tara:strand:+ start:301 stop:561 length:261 start_codon:yes stop_codon:yes gene_type:complete
MDNISNSTEYDSYLVDHVQSYMVTEFQGRGKYEKTSFITLEEAKRYIDIIKQLRPLARIMVYGLSNPPHTSQTVSIAISQEQINAR